MWRNWQTRGVQVAVSFGTWRFESSHPHPMRLPEQRAHLPPWRIHELTRDFELEDVWALPTPGGPDDFPSSFELMAYLRPGARLLRLVRALFAIRWKLGELFGWDDPDDGLGARVTTLRERLPADLRDGAGGPTSAELPFTRAVPDPRRVRGRDRQPDVHGVLHFGWVPDGDGGHRGQMAVLVKPNGLFGRPTWRRSSPSATCSSTRRSCGRSAGLAAWPGGERRIRVQPGTRLGGGFGRRPGGRRSHPWWGSSWRTAPPETWCSA